MKLKQNERALEPGQSARASSGVCKEVLDLLTYLELAGSQGKEDCMRHSLLVAARVEASHPAAHLILGRALRPDGFQALQAPPCSLSPYAAARVRHALARDPHVVDSEVLLCAVTYASSSDCVAHPAILGRLTNLCIRAGATRPAGVALGLMWARTIDSTLLAYAFPHPPHPFLRRAIRSEVARIRLQYKSTLPA